MHRSLAPWRAAAFACASLWAHARAAAPIPVLVFEKRLPASVEPYAAVDSLFRELAPSLGLALRFSEDSTLFTPDSLKPYRLIVWNNVMRNVLSARQQQAFQAWMESGGGWLGFHAAGTNRRLWPWYVDDFLGADNYAADHIAWGTSVLYADTVPREGRTLGVTHPVMRGVPRAVSHYGEYYWWVPDPADNPAITVLQWYRPRAIDTAWPQALPVTWVREVGAGRLFYTQASHVGSLYREAWYRAMVTNALRWAAREGETAILRRRCGPGNPAPPSAGGRDARGRLRSTPPHSPVSARYQRK